MRNEAIVKKLGLMHKEPIRIASHKNHLCIYSGKKHCCSMWPAPNVAARYYHYNPVYKTSPMLSPDSLRAIFAPCRTIAVVGLSPKPHRDSYHVAQYLQQQGYRIVPINPVAAQAGASILGQPCYASLSQAAQALAAQHIHIDMVNVFRNSADVPPIAQEAIAIGAPCLWLQLGIRHDEAAAQARAAGLQVVQDRCTLVEHQRLYATGPF